MLIAYWVIIYS